MTLDTRLVSKCDANGFRCFGSIGCCPVCSSPILLVASARRAGAQLPLALEAAWLWYVLVFQLEAARTGTGGLPFPTTLKTKTCFRQLGQGGARLKYTKVGYGHLSLTYWTSTRSPCSCGLLICVSNACPWSWISSRWASSVLTPR